jgi:hypothetical protein
MGVIQFVDEFRALHTRARQGDLAESDRAGYLSAREQFAQALLAAQGLMLEGESARRAFRVALALPVELVAGPDKALRATTLDVSCGGFSTLLAEPPQEGQGVEVSLRMGEEARPLLTHARVASVVRRGEGRYRVSFAFVGLAEPEVERLEVLLLDAALERVGLVG